MLLFVCWVTFARIKVAERGSRICYSGLLPQSLAGGWHPSEIKLPHGRLSPPPPLIMASSGALGLCTLSPHRKAVSY